MEEEQGLQKGKKVALLDPVVRRVDAGEGKKTCCSYSKNAREKNGGNNRKNKNPKNPVRAGRRDSQSARL